MRGLSYLHILLMCSEAYMNLNGYFDIYCLTKFANQECLLWFGYLHPDFYIINCKSTPKTIKNLAHLNDELCGDKDYEVLQYIHKYVLDIVSILLQSIVHLHKFLSYVQFTSQSTIVIHEDIKIAKILYKLQCNANKIN